MTSGLTRTTITLALATLALGLLGIPTAIAGQRESSVTTSSSSQADGLDESSDTAANDAELVHYRGTSKQVQNDPNVEPAGYVSSNSRDERHAYDRHRAEEPVPQSASRPGASRSTWSGERTARPAASAAASRAQMTTASYGSSSNSSSPANTTTNTSRKAARRPSQFDQALRQTQWDGPPQRARGPVRRAAHQQVRYQEALPEPIAEPYNGEMHYDGEMGGDMGYGGPEFGGYESGGDDFFGYDQGGGCDDCGSCQRCGSGFAGCNNGSCDICGGCGGSNYRAPDTRPPFTCDWFWWENLSIFGSSQGFRSPVDMGRNGNFGFGYGVNWGGPLWQWANLGYQIGARGVHTNFSGNQIFNRQSNEGRSQAFLTTGVFRRVRCQGPGGGGFQWGVVGDWLQDQYYVTMNLGQVRGEFSFIGPYEHELGFWFASGARTDTQTVAAQGNIPEFDVTWSVNDIYSLFYRRTFCNGAQGRLYAGASSDGDGLFGGDFSCPLGQAWALQANFTMVEPHEGQNQVGQQQETWALSINLAWYLGRTACCSMRSPWRPMFNVADNSNFILETVQPNQAN